MAKKYENCMDFMVYEVFDAMNPEKPMYHLKAQFEKESHAKLFIKTISKNSDRKYELFKNDEDCEFERRIFMREFKFRIWEETAGKMHNEDFQVMPDGEIVPLDLNGNPTESFKLIPMQYTGLKDNNGKEIYEGDILKMNYEDGDEDTGGKYYCEEVLVVRWDEKWAGYIFGIVKKNQVHSGREYCWDEIFTNRIEIIGNVYENPELFGA